MNEELEKYVQDPCSNIQNAIRAAGTRSRNNNAKPALWWTPECKAAHVKYRREFSPTEVASLVKKFRSTVATAKREHWKQIIESIDTPSKVFKMMLWWRPQQAKKPPPLIFEGKIISDQKECASILRDSLLARHEELDDSSPCTEPSNATIPLADELTNKEVCTCTIGCGNKSPGPDGITVQLLIATWYKIRFFIVKIFCSCIRLGTYSTCFKLAEVVLLQNSGRDPSSVKGWMYKALFVTDYARCWITGLCFRPSLEKKPCITWQL